MVDVTGRRGLGRGLSALLEEGDPETVLATAPTDSRAEIAIELLRPNPDQPRRRFDSEELEELTASIRERGILQPILVRPAPGATSGYQIVAGERRWRAAQQAQLHIVPVLIRAFNDAEVAEIGIIENVQRADLDPLEEAQGYKTLIERFGRTQESVSKTVGKSRSHIANSLRLLGLPEAVRDHLAAGRLSAGHARAIATSADPAQLASAIVDQDLSVRQAEALARKAQNRASRSPVPSKAKNSHAKDADTQALERDLSDLLGLKVDIQDQGGAGEIRIQYASLEQLDEVCRRLSNPLA